MSRVDEQNRNFHFKVILLAFLQTSSNTRKNLEKFYSDFRGWSMRPQRVSCMKNENSVFILSVFTSQMLLIFFHSLSPLQFLHLELIFIHPVLLLLCWWWFRSTFMKMDYHIKLFCFLSRLIFFPFAFFSLFVWRIVEKFFNNVKWKNILSFSWISMVLGLTFFSADSKTLDDPFTVLMYKSLDYGINFGMLCFSVFDLQNSINPFNPSPPPQTRIGLLEIFLKTFQSPSSAALDFLFCFHFRTISSW